jgi:hypothetical protein
VPRPATVKVAVVLQLLAAAALLALAALAIVSAVRFNQVISEAARVVEADPEDVGSVRDENVIYAVLLSAPATVVAAVLAALAWPVWRGGNAVRIISAVGAGLNLLGCLLSPCGPGFALIAVVDPAFLVDGSFGTSFGEELRRHRPPLWLAIGMPVLAALVFAASVAVLTLLLVPPSNRFFRRGGPGPRYVPVYYAGPVYPYPYPYPYPDPHPYPYPYPQPYPHQPPAPGVPPPGPSARVRFAGRVGASPGGRVGVCRPAVVASGVRAPVPTANVISDLREGRSRVRFHALGGGETAADDRHHFHLAALPRGNAHADQCDRDPVRHGDRRRCHA